MTLHPSVAAYGHRRGYSEMDINRLFSQDPLDYGYVAHNDGSSNNYASDLTLNLSEPSVYHNELSLFVSFYNSLSAVHRQRLRKYADGLASYFTNKLSLFGCPPDILSSVVQLYDFPKQDAADSPVVSAEVIAGEPADYHLVKNFLSKFRAPLIYEYFVSETNLFPLSLERSEGCMRENAGDDPPSEEDDDVNPAWWKNGEYMEQQECDEKKGNVDSRMDSALSEIHDICSKVESYENSVENRLFPYSVKFYNSRSHGSSPVCAALSHNGDSAFFGCSGDSSVHCFTLRRSARSKSLAYEDTAILHVNSKSGIVYRLGLLEDNFGSSFLIATSDDPSSPVTLFDVGSKKEICSYRGHRWPVWALDVRDRGGGMFLTGSYDHTARFFLLDRKDPVRIFVGHESSVDCVQFIDTSGSQDLSFGDSSYPTFVATASSDRTVRVWSLNDAIPVRMFHGMKGSPTALTVQQASPNGSQEHLLACATTEGKIFIWDLRSGKPYQTLDNVLANDMAFSLDGNYLVAGGDNGFFKIYQWSKERGEFNSHYVEMHVAQNVLSHNKEVNLLNLRFVSDELVCLSA